MKREYYSDSITSFLATSSDKILGRLTDNSEFPVQPTQKDAWLEQIRILKRVLQGNKGWIYFEYSIPRMGRRIDTVLLIGPVIYVLEFKIGGDHFHAQDVDQVWDYALDLKNFHSASHTPYIAPVLICTEADADLQVIEETPLDEKVIRPIRTNSKFLGDVISNVLQYAEGANIDHAVWDTAEYSPTPTIIEAAVALYAGHSVSAISRRDASAHNLTRTTKAISRIIASSIKHSRKAICFLTGVPGAGKTLVGLNIATQHMDPENKLYSVYLSGNGPLVEVLRVALTRNKVHIEKAKGKKRPRGAALRAVKLFIQNVHNFRDECLVKSAPPREHVAIFDEAQRAWDAHKTSDFMRRRKKKPNFNRSEPDFLISCLDRHSDWAVIICLVGGGQEIYAGEAGISEWIESINRAYMKWDIHISPRLLDSEYGSGKILETLTSRERVYYKEDLHLDVSMRSFRAENVSLLVKQILDLQLDEARATLARIGNNYPMAITRDLQKAKSWLKRYARALQRYGIVASSRAQRLKPYAINVKSPTDPVHWFLDDRNDVRSSYYLEDVATEFQIQGLELDWVCVTWDGDFRYSPNGWDHQEFRGTKWNKIKKAQRQIYLKNAYRVLLTRARQGMVIVVPQGDPEDRTRKSEFYDPTFEYLKQIGFPVID